MRNNEIEWKEKWEEIYDKELLGYKKRIIDKAYPLSEHGLFVKYLYPTKKLSTNNIILEIGCGQGNLMHNLYDKVKEIHGTDISQSAINRAKYFFRFEKNVFLYAETDLIKLFPSLKFDLIYSITVFQHLPKYQTLKYFNEVYNLLKDDGVFFFNVMSDYNRCNFDATIEDLNINRHHTSVSFTEDELKLSLKNAGFKNINIVFMGVTIDNPKYGWFIGIIKK